MFSSRDIKLLKQVLDRRGAIPAPTPKARPIWTFLNSSFGIFLLSSVFLSGLTFAYSSWRDMVATKAQAAESVKRLDLEISSRFAQLKPLADPPFTFSALLTARAATTGESLPNILDRFYVVFPEYRDRSVVSLLWELRSLVPADEVAGVQAALQAARSIPIFLGRDRVELVTPRGEQDSTWRFKDGAYAEYEKNVLATFKLGRWSQ